MLPWDGPFQEHSLYSLHDIASRNKNKKERPEILPLYTAPLPELPSETWCDRPPPAIPAPAVRHTLYTFETPLDRALHNTCWMELSCPTNQSIRPHENTKIDVQRSLDPTSRATISIAAERGSLYYAHKRGARPNTSATTRPNTSATHKRGFPTNTGRTRNSQENDKFPNSTRDQLYPETFQKNEVSQLNTGPILSRNFPGNVSQLKTRDQPFPDYCFSREQGVLPNSVTRDQAFARNMASQRIKGPEFSRKKI